MAFIRNTDKFVEGASNKFFSDGRAQLALQPTVTSLEGEDSGMKLRLDVIEGGAGVSGSIAKAQADAQSYADQQIAALVNSAPEVLDTLKELSDAIGGDQNFAATVSGQIGAVDAKVDQEILDRAAAVSALESSLGADVSTLQSADSALSLRLDELELDPVTKSYVDSQDSGLQSSINSESSARQSADSALSGRLDVIEGVGEGSVAKAEQDAKDYADGLDSAMDARMLVLEADPTTKTYVDGEVSNLQGQITQEISDRQADVDAEEQRALAAEGLLSGRLDTLELDPVTKTYVDGEVSDLQGQVDIEKGRIDAILLSADADKDSFAEIVQLINSVDTTNDQAFAGYVASNDAALAQEVSDRQSGDSALSGRLDVLEADPTTKAYVDGEVDNLEAEDLTMVKLDGSRPMSGNLQVPVGFEMVRPTEEARGFGKMIFENFTDPSGNDQTQIKFRLQRNSSDSKERLPMQLQVDTAIFGRGLAYRIVRRSSNYNVPNSEPFQIATAVNIDYTLPSAPVHGQMHTFKDSTGSCNEQNPINIQSFSAAIDGGVSFQLTAPYESVSMIYDSTLNMWLVL